MVACSNDLLIISKKMNTTTIVKNKLRKFLVLKDLGRAFEFVGMAIDYDDMELERP